MPLKKVEVLRNRVFTIGGHRISRNSNKVEVPIKRDKLDVTCYEDKGKHSLKGQHDESITIEGYGTETETAIIEMFIEDEASFPFILLRDVTITGTPIAAIGSPAYVMDARIFEIPMEPSAQGTVKGFRVVAQPAGAQLYFSKVLFTNVGDAALEDGETITDALELDELVEDFELAIAVAVVDYPPLDGTEPIVTIELISSALDDMSDPSVQYAFDDFTEPGAAFALLDGDLAPVPSETFWALRINVSSSGTDAAATVIAAIALVAKT